MGGRGTSDGSQMGKVMGTAASHTSMRIMGPSAGGRRGVRTGEARVGMKSIGTSIGPEARSRDHKQRTAAEKRGKSIIVSWVDG